MDEGMEFYTGLPQWNAIMLLYDMFFGKAHAMALMRRGDGRIRETTLQA